MSYDFTIDHIRELLAVTDLRNMSLPEGFATTSMEELQRIYNGIGPEAWGSSFRCCITKLLNWLETPALIHDWEYEFAPRTYGAFTQANLRLVWNSWKDGRFKIGLAAGLLCQIGGWGAFKNGGVSDPSDQSDQSDRSAERGEV